MAEEKGNGNEKNKEEKAKGEASQENQKQEGKEAQQAQQAQQANKEVEELRDRLLRLAAEFDNYKKMVQRDIDNAKNMGKAELIAKLLPAIDAFEIALLSMPEREKETVKGLELVFTELYDTLKKEGLEEIPAKGKLDPYKHEVLLARPSDKEEGTILEVVRKGYMFNGIMIRPASVIVSNGKKE